MKDNFTELDRALKGWRVTSPLPPRFQENVWKRIERADAANVSVTDALRAWFKIRFTQPAFATAYVTALVAAGLALGFIQANHKNTQLDRQLETRYVTAVDPYQRGH